MTVTQVAFILISVITLGSALAMVTSRTVFVAALWMVAAFAGVAGLFVLLEAGFLAAIQILIYAGGIAILILFAIMLTPRVMRPMEGLGRFNNQWMLAAALNLALFAALGTLVARTELAGQPATSDQRLRRPAGPRVHDPLPVAV